MLRCLQVPLLNLVGYMGVCFMSFLSAVHVYLSCVWISWLKYIFIYHAIFNMEIAEKGVCI